MARDICDANASSDRCHEGSRLQSKGGGVARRSPWRVRLKQRGLEATSHGKGGTECSEAGKNRGVLGTERRPV